MTQEERWQLRYNEVKSFIEENHRNPSKYNLEDRGDRYLFHGITKSVIINS